MKGEGPQSIHCVTFPKYVRPPWENLTIQFNVVHCSDKAPCTHDLRSLRPRKECGKRTNVDNALHPPRRIDSLAVVPQYHWAVHLFTWLQNDVNKFSTMSLHLRHMRSAFMEATSCYTLLAACSKDCSLLLRYSTR
jgi:hypothetical protein